MKIVLCASAANVTLEQLIEIGIANADYQGAAYRERNGLYDVQPRGYHTADEHTLHRWAVNYARHSLTNYDQEISRIMYVPDIEYGECGTQGLPTDEYGEEDHSECEACLGASVECSDAEDEEKLQLKREALKVIAQRWPELADECERQAE